MGLNAAVQALKKAEPLKDKVQRYKDLLTDNDAWVCQQQLQKIYQQVLILDLEYALDKKVEQELWNLGFKNYIVLLQNQAKDRKSPKRLESQALLSWYLEAASGFYLTLLQEICTAFDLDLPFRRKGYIYGCISPWKAIENLSTPHKSSCFYACQYCLVHLGDIARYRNQNRQAELFYRHAVFLSPSSGQPYNQLALLEASRGDKLGTVFHYVRSVAVKHPFPVATSNLAKTLSSALNDHPFTTSGKAKLNSQEYTSLFLKLQGILQTLGDLQLAKVYVKILSDTLTALVATESFTSWRLIQMLIINMYSLYHTAGHTFEGHMDLMKVDQLSPDEQTARNCILDLIAASLSALLLPVYTLKNSYIEYFALPSIKLLLEWICQQPMILEDITFSSRLQIWPSLCVLLNGLQNGISDFDEENFTKTPLPEDRDLQGFLPLEKTFDSLRFCNNDLEGDIISINKLRAVRIINLGRRLAQCQVNGRTLLNVTCMDNNKIKFTCVSDASGPSNELMKELEELSLNKERQISFTASPVPSESASSKGSSEAEITEQSSFAQSTFAKKVGILKSQGVVERNRDVCNPINYEGQNNSNEMNGALTRKTRQNIAMQAIMRRVENEQKQVTFKNVSPMSVEELEVKKNLEPDYFNSLKTFETPTAVRNPQPPTLPPVPIPPIETQHPVQCFQGDQKSLQPQFRASEFTTGQLDKNFGFNVMPHVPQFPPRQFNLQQVVTNIQGPPLAKPSPSNVSHPSMMMNLQSHPQEIPHPGFFERNLHQQSVPVGMDVISLGNYQKNGKGFQVDMPYFKPGQMEQFQQKPLHINDSAVLQQPNYQMYRSHEVDYNPWKDPQPPPPPMSWWGSTDKDKPERDAFQSWVNPPVVRNQLSMADNYYEKSQIEESRGCDIEQMKRPVNTPNTYSLFSENSWGAAVQSSNLALDQPKPRLSQQSLWSGPGPSPLERLLEQQKSLREGGT
ncbi:protein SMG7 [Fopius arisanus]|uniref:Protein SMG7 n=1 Tax=Fopius arisanus TaxID=64838 RepID=A0A0C9R453_9HYME|nr:PREDICTED: protein SMG7-like [Fopius arisanus]XP_011314140.1 PREDICTED: protein SMG7-like [Fopius arisanus]